jgi:DNA-binding MarR family transcriptional regulator
MSERHSIIPFDLSNLPCVPSAEFAAILNHDLADEPDEALARLTAVVTDRVIRQVRLGSSRECLEEALALHGFLETAHGEKLKAHKPRFFHAWQALAAVLSVAGRRSDRTAIDAILKSHATHGRKLLEFLATQAESVRRADVVEFLDISESQVSHLLRDLEEAELVLRYRPEGVKEVLVELGPAGREVVDRSIAPPWVDRLVEYLRTLKTDGVIEDDLTSLTDMLTQKGAPSRWVAEKLASALVDMNAGRRDAGLAFIELYETESPDFARIRENQGDRRPVGSFAQGPA